MPQHLVRLFPGITWKTDNSPNDAMALEEELGRQKETPVACFVLAACDKILQDRKEFRTTCLVFKQESKG